MGQKVKPIGLRVGINRTWDSRWYAGRNYGTLLHQDIQLRAYLMDRLKQAKFCDIPNTNRSVAGAHIQRLCLCRAIIYRRTG